MATVSVQIAKVDRNVGAMAKALAVEVAGFSAVSGTTKEFLALHGRLDFFFETQDKAAEFRALVAEYLHGRATVQE